MKFILFAFLFSVIITQNISAQWLPDVRLTNSPGDSKSWEENNQCIASNGNNLIVVWSDGRLAHPYYNIYYKLSADGGDTWGPDVLLSYSFTSEAPVVGVSGSFIHIVWNDSRDSSNDEIYYKRSTDGGASWGEDTRLTFNSSNSLRPSISVNGSNIHIAWYDSRTQYYDIYYKNSTNDGISWGPDVRISNGNNDNRYPIISATGSNIHVVWQDAHVGNEEIYYKHSTNNGSNWSSVARLTIDSAISEDPFIFASGSNVHIAWADKRDGGNTEIYYKRSTDGGTSWSSDVRLTNSPSTSDYPAIVVSGSKVHLVWHDYRDGNMEIYYKLSTDGGSSWGTDVRLTNSPDYSLIPSIAINASTVNVMWHDRRDGPYSSEIYYKKNPTGNVTGINYSNLEIPENFTLLQNYPNPFNPTTVIRYSIPEGTGRDLSVQLKVYDLNGKEVASLVNDKQSAGSYSVEFDGSKFASGVYFYTLSVGEFKETRKMLLVK